MDYLRAALQDRRLVLWGACLLLFTLTMFLFWPAVGYDFLLWDDNFYVSDNPIVRNGLSMGGWKWAWTTNHQGYWAPILWLSLMLDGTLFGPEPWGFHLSNILLHALNVMLLFLLFRKWTGRAWPSLLLAAFWAWHPLRVESVAWIVERKDVLSGLFFFLCLWAYDAFSRSSSPRWRMGWVWVCALLLALGLMTKPVLITVPFILLLLDIWPYRRLEFNQFWYQLPRRILEKWPIWVCTALLGYASWAANAQFGIVRADVPDLWHRILLVPGNYLTYLDQMLIPCSLSPAYHEPQWLPIRFGVALFILLSLMLVSWWNRKKRPAFGVGWLWFLGMLVPSIGFVWMGTTEGLGDRFSYLPMVGICLILYAVLSISRPCLQRVFSVLFIGLLCGYAYGTSRLLPIWKTSESLFDRGIRMAPRHSFMHLNKGALLMEQKKWSEALEFLRHSMTLHPPHALGLLNQGVVYLHQGRPSQAIEVLRMAQPTWKHEITMQNTMLGWTYLDMGLPKRAIPFLKTAARLSPKDSAVWIELLRAGYEAGDGLAIQEASQALEELMGIPVSAYEDLFTAYVQYWREGYEVRPLIYFAALMERMWDSPEHLNNIAWVLATQDVENERAAALAQKAIARANELLPNNATILDTWSVVLARSEDYIRAIQTADLAIQHANVQGNTQLVLKVEERKVQFEQEKPWNE